MEVGGAGVRTRWKTIMLLVESTVYKRVSIMYHFPLYNLNLFMLYECIHKGVHMWHANAAEVTVLGWDYTAKVMDM